jgi:hypothetical protein
LIAVETPNGCRSQFQVRQRDYTGVHINQFIYRDCKDSQIQIVDTHRLRDCANKLKEIKEIVGTHHFCAFFDLSGNELRFVLREHL